MIELPWAQVVLLLAPDRFGPDDRLDLDSGFVEINNGLESCKDMIVEDGLLESLTEMSRAAELAYREGNIRVGARMLQEIRNSLSV